MATPCVVRRGSEGPSPSIAGMNPAVPRPLIDWQAPAIVLLAATLFGTLGVLSREAYAQGLTPFAWVAWRALVATLGLSVLLGLRSGASGLRGLRAATIGARRSLALAIVAGSVLNLS